jgi:penicillin-binding protein 2
MQRTGRLSTPRPVRLRRSFIARGFLGLCFLILMGAAARLQVLEADTYVVIARKNMLRELVVPAPRGTIYDRKGQVIAENTVGYRVMLMPGNRDSMNAQLERLKPVLGLTDDDITRAKRKWDRERHLPMTVLGDATQDAVARLEEQRMLFPGVLVHEYAKRHYPSGSAVAHLIGYVSEISPTQLEDTITWKGYTQGRWIGKDGLERKYEKLLGGEPGARYLEIDAMGRIRRWLSDTLSVPPIPGRDLQLHLDLDLQRYIQGIWPRQFRGGFVAIEPQTGGVLAYYSHPSYDANKFIGGIPQKLWDSLQADPAKPLLDRAGGSGSAQPPASTWKLVVAATALEEGVITPEEFMPIACSGGMTVYGRYFRCWEKAGHGRVDLLRGIYLSCDVYFYQVGMRLGLKRYVEAGARMGFAKKTSIDLPSEARNYFPTSLDYWKKTYGYEATPTEVASMAIGQGPISMSPLKMATFYMALARPDGRAPAPRIAKLENDTSQKTVIDMGLTPDRIAWLHKGMRRVVSPGGTAQRTRLKDWDLMGKTGTAQACATCPLKDHAWFVGMAGPYGKEPEIVAAMFLQHAEHGWTASDYVANAIDFYLDRKYGRPFERYATPRSRNNAGLPVDEAWWNSPIVDPPIPGQTVDTTKATARKPRGN